MEATNIEIKTRVITPKDKNAPFYEVTLKGKRIDNVFAVVLMDVYQDGKKVN